jgi:hypothetical protein
VQLGAPQIYNPNALPMYRDESMYGRPANKRKRAEMEEAERRRRKQPEMGGMPKGAPWRCLPALCALLELSWLFCPPSFGK